MMCMSRIGATDDAFRGLNNILPVDSNEWKATLATLATKPKLQPVQDLFDLSYSGLYIIICSSHFIHQELTLNTGATLRHTLLYSGNPSPPHSLFEASTTTLSSHFIRLFPSGLFHIHNSPFSQTSWITYPTLRPLSNTSHHASHASSLLGCFTRSFSVHSLT